MLGSVFVVWLNARQQRRLQAAEFADRAETRRARWAEDRSRAARAAELDACVHLDAAIALALGQLTRMVDLAGRPGVRRKLMGRRWAQQWNEGVANATAELAVPLSPVRLTARPGVRDAVEAVSLAFEAAATAVASLPTWVPEPLLHGSLASHWRERVNAASASVQEARRRLAEVLEDGGEAAV